MLYILQMYQVREGAVAAVHHLPLQNMKSQIKGIKKIRTLRMMKIYLIKRKTRRRERRKTEKIEFKTKQKKRAAASLLSISAVPPFVLLRGNPSHPTTSTAAHCPTFAWKPIPLEGGGMSPIRMAGARLPMLSSPSPLGTQTRALADFIDSSLQRQQWRYMLFIYIYI